MVGDFTYDTIYPVPRVAGRGFGYNLIQYAHVQTIAQ